MKPLQATESFIPLALDPELKWGSAGLLYSSVTSVEGDPPRHLAGPSLPGPCLLTMAIALSSYSLRHTLVD